MSAASVVSSPMSMRGVSSMRDPPECTLLLLMLALSQLPPLPCRHMPDPDANASLFRRIACTSRRACARLCSTTRRPAAAPFCTRCSERFTAFHRRTIMRLVISCTSAELPLTVRSTSEGVENAPTMAVKKTVMPLLLWVSACSMRQFCSAAAKCSGVRACGPGELTHPTTSCTALGSAASMSKHGLFSSTALCMSERSGILNSWRARMRLLEEGGAPDCLLPSRLAAGEVDSHSEADSAPFTRSWCSSSTRSTRWKVSTAFMWMAQISSWCIVCTVV
mmetsp:Transcript_27792/g.60774  ORF Transcript_27792/g.60774 Transcript_27792/m.60774 type:complete len:278 (-) Transcript_27792:2265-3098(-)